ncbi:MAG: fliC 2 [Alphaproteobacteria bacterium]|jgi:flagellin-like hook-associated protein FlgL|nr:fliC 2 [Alphaproteobacteria bacterium]
MADVTLTAALRSNLLSIQGTQRLLDSTQLRLATGLKVNSALDNPSAFFASQSLTNRANDLNRLLDGQGQAIQVLKAADEGIKQITSFLEQAQAIAQEAQDQLNADPLADVSSLGASFDEVLNQVDALAGDSGYRGSNLVAGASTLSVTFNEAGDSTLDVVGADLTIGNDLTVALTGGTWADTTATQATLDAIAADLTTVRNTAASFGTSLNIIQTRQDFTQNLINVLKEGSDKLTVADKNEEGAKLLSLQTTQQLGITSLSLASQSNQAVLRLFG